MDDNNKSEGAIPSVNDRGDLSIKNKKKQSKANLYIGIAVIIGILSISGGVLAYIFHDDEPVNKDKKPEITNESFIKDDTHIGGLKNLLKAAREREAEKTQREELDRKAAQAEALKNIKVKPVKTASIGAPPPPPPPPPKVIHSANYQHKGDKVMSPHIRKMQSDVMVVVAQQQIGRNDKKAKTNNSLDVPKYENGSATHYKKSYRRFLINHGTNIPCILKTEIISEYDGIVQCQVSSDIWSASGEVKLIERGSLVTGQQNVNIDNGMARAFITWGDIQTTSGNFVQINSLGTGQLGAAGVDAWIDNHYAQRFGGAILLSLLDDAFANIFNNNKGSNSYSFDSSEENASDMASKALEHSIDIAPTGYIAIGKRMNILVARDIDMSSVYSIN